MIGNQEFLAGLLKAEEAKHEAETNESNEIDKPEKTEETPISEEPVAIEELEINSENETEPEPEAEPEIEENTNPIEEKLERPETPDKSVRKRLIKTETSE